LCLLEHRQVMIRDFININKGSNFWQEWAEILFCFNVIISPQTAVFLLGTICTNFQWVGILALATSLFVSRSPLMEVLGGASMSSFGTVCTKGGRKECYTILMLLSTECSLSMNQMQQKSKHEFITRVTW
jgi:hypothetical protein